MSETEQSQGGGAATPRPYAPDFGTLTAPAYPRPGTGQGKFRIALLGDFSARAHRGALETGAALAVRRPMKLDVDTLDQVIARCRTSLTLDLGAEGSAVTVDPGALDDLHPDALFANLGLFGGLARLRARVKSGATRTLDELRAWGVEYHGFRPAPRSPSADQIPADRRLSDFARLIGATAPRPESAATEELVRQVVAPHIVAAPSPDQPAMLAAIDAALSAAMRGLLHHPDFQSLEASWRALDFLARRIETDDELELAVFDIAAQEFAAGLSAGAELSHSALFRLLAEQPFEAADPFGAIIGLYSFEETPPHAELLGRMARIAAHVGAPFVAGISTGFLATPLAERHPLVAAAWDALREMPEASHLGLACPRFLLRHPYGRRSDPIDSFGFEEFTLGEGMKGLLLAHPALVVAVLLAAAVREGGAATGAVMSLDDMPFHTMTDAEGDQVALPCTERLFSAAKAAQIIERGYMPLLSVKGRNLVRLGSFQSLQGDTLPGPWGEAAPAAPASRRATLTLTMPRPPAAADELDALLAARARPAPADESGIEAGLRTLLGDL